MLQTAQRAVAMPDRATAPKPPVRQADASPLGNQARLRMLSAKPAPGALRIGPADDPLEHEADAVAERVMRMPDPEVSVRPAFPQLSRKCAACEEEEKLQKKPVGPTAGATQAPAIVHEVLRSPGAPLDAPTRDFMEPRFGRDFGDVRVHADARAAESARALEALAYTVGRNVVFAAGHYAPQSAAGRQLLAHELSHVVQQRGSGSSETIRRHLVFGSGFKQPSLMVEAGRLQRGTWHPSSLDYKATAENSGGGEGRLLPFDP